MEGTTKGSGGRLGARWRLLPPASLRRWARLRRVAHELTGVSSEFVPHFSDYVFAREVGLTQNQVFGLWLDGVEVEPVCSAIAGGIAPSEAFVTSRITNFDFEGYASARRAGVEHQEAMLLHELGIDLDVYAAVTYHGAINQALGVATTGVCGLGYRVCREVGLSHEQVMQVHERGGSLWSAAQHHRRRSGLPYDEFDKFLEQAAYRVNRSNVGRAQGSDHSP